MGKRERETEKINLLFTVVNKHSDLQTERKLTRLAKPLRSSEPRWLAQRHALAFHRAVSKPSDREREFYRDSLSQLFQITTFFFFFFLHASQNLHRSGWLSGG